VNGLHAQVCSKGKLSPPAILAIPKLSCPSPASEEFTGYTPAARFVGPRPWGTHVLPGPSGNTGVAELPLCPNPSDLRLPRVGLKAELLNWYGNAAWIRHQNGVVLRGSTCDELVIG
jgi:hypothetical protein